MAEFLMPALGADMEAGTLVAWRKQPGEPVGRGEIIAEVETEKGLIEVECFVEGVVSSLLVSPGSKVPVGTTLAMIKENAAGGSPSPTPPSADQLTAPPAQSRAAATPSARRLSHERGVDIAAVHGTGAHGTVTRSDVLATAPKAVGESSPRSAEGSSASTHVRASPLARRMADARGVSLQSIGGTGPLGAVVAADVQRALSQPGAEPRAGDAAAAMRQAIARAMSRSKREIPHYYLSHTVDVGTVLTWLKERNEQRSVPDRLLAAVLFVRAIALALRKVPELNAHYMERGLEVLSNVNVGVAISLRGGGLLAPAISNADRLTLDELNVAFKDLVNRARAGQLRSSEMSSATITLTSLGERGVETVFPVIVPPQVAMVGVGAIIERPVVVAGAVVVRPTVIVTLAADHRVSDGHRGAVFLSAVANALKEPPS